MARRELELKPAAMRELLEAVSERVTAHIASLPHQAAADVEGAVELARRQAETLPEEGAPLESILDLLFDELAEKSFNTAGPGYLAYVPGGGLFQSAVADLIAGALNRYTGVFAAAPPLVQLEINVIRWLCEIVGYPPSALGFLASGGSMATLSALAAARVDRLGEEFQDGVLYTSDQAHHCIAKAASLAGFPPSRLRVVPSDESFRMRPGALREQVVKDRRRGLRPFLVVASAGTTNSGAVDPFPELAACCHEERLWFHVDAAYGGFFALTERGRIVLAGLEAADSLVLDPHKGLFLPYGNGALLVRDGTALRRAHGQRADYMPPIQDDPDLIDFCEVSPELSRPYRGLQVWLPVKLHGIGAFRENLDEKLDLIEWIHERLQKLPRVEILAAPQLSTLAFAVRLEGASADELDRATRGVHTAINRRQRIHVTATRLRGRYAIRICVLSFRTHLDRMEMALEDIQSSLEEVLE